MSGLEAVVIVNAAKTRALKSVLIAAETKDGNYGSDYFGLSAVRFVTGREVAEADLPVPTGMACAALPYSPYRPDGKPGREIAVSLRDAKLYGAVTFDVECAGAKEQTVVPANPRGADHFSIFMPASAGVTNECEATITLQSGRAALQQTVSVPACKPRVYYILMHSHCDIGYTDIQPHIAAKQAHNVIHALELIEKTRDYPPAAQFKWNTEGFLAGRSILQDRHAGAESRNSSRPCASIASAWTRCMATCSPVWSAARSFCARWNSPPPWAGAAA